MAGLMISLVICGQKQDFLINTAKRTHGTHRLLIFRVDEHGSHATQEFMQLCGDNNTIVLVMPPHTSHMLQPLDVECFAPLEFAYTKELAERQRIRIFRVGKDNFLLMYERTRKISINKTNIKKSFKASGIVPLNPDQVISKLDVCIRTPPGSEVSEEVELDPDKPRNMNEMIWHQTITHELIVSGDASPRELKRRFDQSFKANQISFGE